jgi:hypothetical protein
MGLDTLDQSAVIISASGMCESGLAAGTWESDPRPTPKSGGHSAMR